MDALAEIIASFMILCEVLALAIIAGCLIALMQPIQRRDNLRMLLFCGAAALWVLLSLSAASTNMRFGLPIGTVLALRLLAAVLVGQAFLVFALHYAQVKNTLSDLLVLSIPLVWLVGLLLAANAYSYPTSIPSGASSDSSVVAAEPASYFLLIIGLAYLLISGYFILDSRAAHAEQLRPPAALWLLGYIGLFVGGLDFLSAVLLAVAILWITWLLTKEQFQKPIEELQEELRTVNRDLRQVVGDLNTEKRKNEALNTQLSDAKTYRSDFLAKMSHELRTPLNSIIGYSELLMGGTYGPVNETQSDRLSKIHRNGRSLLEVINDMLDLSKIDAGRLELEFQPFPLETILEPLITELQEQCANKGLTAQVNIEDNLPILYGDHYRVQQIIRNLTSNAVKFTRAGSVTLKAEAITVKNGLSEKFKLPSMGWLNDGDWLIISIVDTGIGIAPEDQGRIFDEFWQVDNSRTREFEGPGLGLAISKKLVLMHSGFIWLTSVLGKGSTFYVALPTNVIPQSKQHEPNGTQSDSSALTETVRH